MTSPLSRFFCQMCPSWCLFLSTANFLEKLIISFWLQNTSTVDCRGFFGKCFHNFCISVIDGLSLNYKIAFSHRLFYFSCINVIIFSNSIINYLFNTSIHLCTFNSPGFTSMHCYCIAFFIVPEARFCSCTAPDTPWPLPQVVSLRKGDPYCLFGLCPDGPMSAGPVTRCLPFSPNPRPGSMGDPQ